MPWEKKSGNSRKRKFSGTSALVNSLYEELFLFYNIIIRRWHLYMLQKISSPRYLSASIGVCFFLFTLQFFFALRAVRFCVTGRARSSFRPHSSAFTLCAQASILLSGVSRRSPPLESNFTYISHTASAPGQRAFMSFITCPGQPPFVMNGTTVLPFAHE